MKRASDKIKDFVEPQPFEVVQNFATDPARALAAYHFTDATSDLLARWLDALADLPRPPARGGAARALAGLRGVGKSHALAVFAALAALPELRAKVTDAHVATSARRLMNHRYTIVRVERGTRPTLIEEINDSLDRALGGAGGQWGASPAEMLAIAASRAPDATLIVIVDTAFGRERSVERNDGRILSELAAAAPAANCFVALALDDDIAGAEGINAALVSAYQIDYLDPEHLFRVADQFVLKKTATARVGLHEIYMHLRGALPGFNWSEPRFSALYPVHPLIADVAAGVRLYAPAFAFLSFASEAATRASGRPAASLVLLDEVFDRAEYELRKAEDLKEAFAGYDELASAGVSQFPIMQRLEVKLTLKALFIISLDGRGATPAEICAALLFYDERNPSLPVERITQTLARLREMSNGALERADDAGEARWRFAVSSSSAFDAALAVAVEKVRATADLDSLLNEAARARFADWPFALFVVTNEANTEASAEGQTFERRTTADFYTLWRGTNRAGKMIFRAAGDAGDAPASESLAGDFRYDWTLTALEAKAEGGSRKAEEQSGVTLEDDDASGLLEIENEDAARPVNLIWRPATLTDEEMNNLLRLTALHSDSALIAEYGEAARAASVSLTAQAERIWTRIYLDEGALDVTSEMNEGDAPRRLKWTEEAHGAATLMSALTILLAPVFDRRFAEHPVFNEILGEAETARLIGDFFGGSNASDAGAQHLARTFAVPLGLAVMRGDTCALDTGDASLKRAWIRDTLALTDAADGDVVPLEIIQRTLKRTPYGLSREAAQLVLSALVAGRRIELVTTDGDRISRRTLGRLLDWETIAGLARAATILQSAEELTAWAYLLIGDESNTNSIADETTRAEVRAALARWLDDWRERRLLESFEELPDAALTTRAFDMASAIRKTFLIAADSIESALTDEIPLEECLQRIADAFNNSPQNFAHAGKQFAEITRFVALLAERERVRDYVSAAEPTGVPEIEAMRRRLSTIADNPHGLLESDASVAEFESLWSEFHERYLEHYAALHERAVGGGGNGDGENETRADKLARGDDWREAESLAELSLVKRERWEEIEEALNANRREQCELDVRAILGESPRCACAFRLSRAADEARFTEELEAAMQRSRTAYRRTLALLRNHLAHALTNLANSPESDSTVANKAKTLAESFTETEVPSRLTRADVELIERALETTGTLPPVRHKLSRDIYGLLTRDELQARLEQWLNDIPEQSALVEVIRDEDAA